MRGNMLFKIGSVLGVIAVSGGCSMTGSFASAGGDKMTIREFAESDTRKIESLVYKKTEGQDLRLLVSKPDGWESGQKRPAMVWIHGGGWTAGAPESFIPHMRYSAARGAVAFSINYRLMNRYKYRNNKKKSKEENAKAKAAKFQEYLNGPSLTDCIEDCADAIKHIRQNADMFGIDTEKVIVIGDSAGGHLASSMGTIVQGESRANVVIDCNGITDLTGKWSNFVKPKGGKSFEESKSDPEWISRAKAVSPVSNITTVDVPFLILHGDQDFVVLEETARAFYSELMKKGADVEFKLYKGAKHAFIVYGYTATLEQITQSILDLDAFLVKRGFLEGPTSIQMPVYKDINSVIASIEGDVTPENKTIKYGKDFPGFQTITMKVKPAKKFNGVLATMPGRYGFRYKINNGGHDFTTIKMRQRGKQIKFKPEVWQDVTISLGRDKVVIKVGDQSTEVVNEHNHAFIADEMIFGEKLKAEIKDVKVYGSADVIANH